MNGPGFEFPSAQNIFLKFRAVQAGFWPTHLSVQWVQGLLERPGREVNLSPPTGVDINSGWN